MTPEQLELCLRLKLVEEREPGVFALTWTARKLLGEKPPTARSETHQEWAARVLGTRKNACEVAP